MSNGASNRRKSSLTRLSKRTRATNKQQSRDGVPLQKDSFTASGGGFEATPRIVVDHTYHDHLHDPILVGRYPNTTTEYGEAAAVAVETTNGKPPRKGPRGGVTETFPEKLYNMLEAVDSENLNHIVSWQPHGRCFLVRQKTEFVENVMPRFFQQSKLTSFQRQLNLYGFIRLTSAGPDRGGYYHERFLKGRPDLCRVMLRTRIKGNGMKAAASPSTEPDFYSMEFCDSVTARPLDETARKEKGIDCCNHATDETTSQQRRASLAESGRTEADCSDSEWSEMSSRSSSRSSSQDKGEGANKRVSFAEIMKTALPPPPTILKSTASFAPPLSVPSCSSPIGEVERAGHSDRAALVSLPSSPRQVKSLQTTHWPAVPSLMSMAVNIAASKMSMEAKPDPIVSTGAPDDMAIESDFEEADEWSGSGSAGKGRLNGCVLKNGDEVFFLGQKFRYLDRLEVDFFVSEQKKQSQLQVKERETERYEMLQPTSVAQV